MTNNGYFEISASDIESSSIRVPQDHVGNNPNGDANDDQDFYDLVTRDNAKQVAIWVINNTDANLTNLAAEGTHLWDDEWNHAQPVQSEGSPSGSEILQASAAIDRLNQLVELDAVPTSGELIVVFRSVDR